jgi:hypothetical protein
MAIVPNNQKYVPKTVLVSKIETKKKKKAELILNCEKQLID